jgi:hypothetical protein
MRWRRGQNGKAIVLTGGPTKLDGNVLVLDEGDVAQAPAEGGEEMSGGLRRTSTMNPITGIDGC